MNQTATDAGAATITVRHCGLGDTGWSVTIDGNELSGGGAQLSQAQEALWNIPAAGGTATVAECGSIPVPHQVAGREAAMDLADLAMVARRRHRDVYSPTQR